MPQCQNGNCGVKISFAQAHKAGNTMGWCQSCIIQNPTLINPVPQSPPKKSKTSTKKQEEVLCDRCRAPVTTGGSPTVSKWHVWGIVAATSIAVAGAVIL